MKLFGIPLRKPHSTELTAAAFMATGLWLAVLGLAHAGGLPLGRFEAGALLVVVGWACLSARLGIRVGAGHRHLIANVLGGAVLLAAYQGAWAFAS